MTPQIENCCKRLAKSVFMAQSAQRRFLDSGGFAASARNDGAENTSCKYTTPL